MIVKTLFVFSAIFGIAGGFNSVIVHPHIHNVFPIDNIGPDSGDDPNIITYPTNPGSPGNYSSQLNMVNYFSNLLEYSPSNKAGSCGTVSFVQVLSYFDTFYNDSIIPEQYDKHYSLSSTNINEHSPGTLRNSLVTPFAGGMSLRSFAIATYSECFDSKIMIDFNNLNNTNNDEHFNSSIGVFGKKQMIDTFFSQYNLTTGIDDDEIGNYYYTYGELLESLSNNEDYDSLMSLIDYYSDAYILDVIDVIDSGYPVVLSINRGLGDNTDPETDYRYELASRHSVVAYDYETIDDEIFLYCNFGWNSSYYNHYPLKQSGYYINGYAPIIYNSSIYNHSDNYVINGLKYCGCSYHTHDLTKTYTNNTKHSITCPCGYLNYENHTDNYSYSCCGGPILPPPGGFGGL